MMRIVFLLLSFMLVKVASSQELMTAEQLVTNSQREEFQLSVAMYVAGWRDGVSRHLLSSAETLRESGAEAGEYADYEEALGVCLGGLGVADLMGVLRPLVVNDEIDSEQVSASTALMDVSVELCQGSLEEALR